MLQDDRARTKSRDDPWSDKIAMKILADMKTDALKHSKKMRVHRHKARRSKSSAWQSLTNREQRMKQHRQMEFAMTVADLESAIEDELMESDWDDDIELSTAINDLKNDLELDQPIDLEPPRFSLEDQVRKLIDDNILDVVPDLESDDESLLPALERRVNDSDSERMKEALNLFLI